jgi:hypothetical protein
MILKIIYLVNPVNPVKKRNEAIWSRRACVELRDPVRSRGIEPDCVRPNEANFTLFLVPLPFPFYLLTFLRNEPNFQEAGSRQIEAFPPKKTKHTYLYAYISIYLYPVHPVNPVKNNNFSSASVPFETKNMILQNKPNFRVIRPQNADILNNQTQLPIQEDIPGAN